jgi:hypothetical protein
MAEKKTNKKTAAKKNSASERDAGKTAPNVTNGTIKATAAPAGRAAAKADKAPTKKTTTASAKKTPQKVAKRAAGTKKAAGKRAPAKFRVGANPWSDVFGDPKLSGPPNPGKPGNVPAGANLDLNIGWIRFEHLMVFVAEANLGLAGVKFRRYGTPGQTQHGIDLAGRRADNSYAVVQCKDYKRFTAASLRAAVKTFATGDRPFDAKHLIIAVSSEADTTQLQDELAAQQDAHPEFTVELWGASQINDLLRERNDIVARFWTRETADTFCTAAPPAGVAAPAPDWLHLSDMILLEPTGMPGIVERINEADALVQSDPSAAADILGEVAQAITEEGFPGHAQGIRRRQFDLLTNAGRHADMVELAAQLAVAALHQGHDDTARLYIHTIEQTKQAHDGAAAGQDDGAKASAANAEITAAAQVHINVLNAAVSAVAHPTGDKDALASQLRELMASGGPEYFSALVLLLAELEAADRIYSLPDGVHPEPHAVSPGAVEYFDDLIAAALKHPGASATNPYDARLAFRLRLIQTRHNPSLHIKLVNDARMLKLTRPEAALTLAAEARRNADQAAPSDAMMNWRRAIQEAIHDGNTNDASGWLYSVRGVRIRYRYFDPSLNDEHYLAQGLPTSGSGSALTRTRDHETQAYREAAENRATAAINAARRWLADSITLSDWVDEASAVELLGDLYARNAEPQRAALCYQWSDEVKKLEQLVQNAGDIALPIRSIDHGPWWIRRAAVRLIALQEDLLDDDTAAAYLRKLTDTIRSSHKGELTDPLGNLRLAALKTACALAGRGTTDDALALLDELESDVEREPNHYRFHDKEHVEACLRIAQAHPTLTDTTLARIFALAGVDCHDALTALSREQVLGLLREPEPDAAKERAITTRRRQHYRDQIAALDEAGKYSANVAACALGVKTSRTTDQVQQAVERLRNRPAADPNMFALEGHLVPDSYLVTKLAPEEAPECLARLMQAAEDRGEAAPNRASALIAARNLIHDVDHATRANVFERAKAFVTGEQDGSHFDDFITNPHPLSTMQVNLGPSTLRGGGLGLAAAAADGRDARNWVAQQAVSAFRSDDTQVAEEAARALNVIGTDLDTPPDPGLLAAHPNPMVKILGTVFAAADPGKFEYVLETSANDPDWRVRKAAADAIAQLHTAKDDSAQHAARRRVLALLAVDKRHSVRAAATRASAVIEAK